MITIADVTVLDQLQKAILKFAAKRQEQFDCEVLELPWDKFTVGTKVNPEAIHEASSKWVRGKDDPTLLDWYPPIVGKAPLHLARIICQRTNLWYDSKLRRQYGGGIIAGTIGLTLLLFAFGVIRGLTSRKRCLSS